MGGRGGKGRAGQGWAPPPPALPVRRELGRGTAANGLCKRSGNGELSPGGGGGRVAGVCAAFPAGSAGGSPGVCPPEFGAGHWKECHPPAPFFRAPERAWSPVACRSGRCLFLL